MTRHRRIALIGAALILGGNAVALLGVAYNHSGEPDAVVDLSERELARPYNFLAAKENSGLALRLVWRNEEAPPTKGGGGAGGAGSRFNKDKLAELGFDAEADPQDPAAIRRYRKALPRRAYVVLEFNGPAYQAMLERRRSELEDAQARLAADPGNNPFRQRVQNAQYRFDQEQNQSSRLIAVDVGPDLAALRSRYSDRSRYLILPGQVRLAPSGRELRGYIAGIDVDTINVPLEHRAATIGTGTRSARYTVRLAVGKRGEPWVMAVQAGGDQND